MDTKTAKQSRRKFILGGIASAAIYSAVRFLLPSKKTQTAKMLTEDGTLVEVDIAAVKSLKKKISNKELQNWVKK